MPNRRRRRLSTATSAFAALAVASPFAYIAFSGLAADIKPAPEHHEFVRAASMTDLPGELMGALTQGLSQFGVSLPPIPALTGATTPDSTSLPGFGSPGLAASPGLTSPGLTSPGLTSPGLTSPGLASPGLSTPGLSTATPGLTPGVTPGLTDPSLASPGLTSPTGFGTAGANPSEVPIGDPIGLDPGVGGTYPILGDPNLGAPAAPSGGLVSDVMSAANQLGAGQAIDLLKGMILPQLQNAAHGAAAPVPPPPAPIP